MKFQQYTLTVAAFHMAFISVSAINGTILAQSATFTTFFCKIINGIPNTVARIENKTNNLLPGASKQIISVLEWTREYYPESQESSLNRCVRVSTLLQTYKNEDRLKYITSGKMDGKRVVCATSSQGNPCSRLLFVLEPSENPAEVVADLRLVINNPNILISPQKSAIVNRWKPPQKSAPLGRARGGAVR